jgi:vitamin B12 transport system permease protein
MSPRNAVVAVSGLFIAVMLGLAAGAVWMVATLYVGRPLPWLAMPAGVLLALTIRLGVRPAGIGAALLAACATVLAALYVNLLIAGVLIAGSMGLGLIEALRTAGFGMLWQLTRLRISAGRYRPYCWPHGWPGVRRASAELTSTAAQARSIRRRCP